MKKILGLDLGTNSIGWAVVNANETSREDKTTYLKPTGISAAGSRIIPMSADILGNFDAGNSVSQTSERTGYRGVRRLHERYLLRRQRLLRVLKLMGFLPEHFVKQIDEQGKFIDYGEPKLAWKKDEYGKYDFVFKGSFNEMLTDFAQYQPQILADGKKVPYDWTIYYLRKKALTQRLTKEELAWILLQFNQKRGYYQLRGEDEDEQYDKLVEFIAQKVVRVEATDEKKGDDVWYNVYLENGMVYRRTSKMPLDWEGKVKEFIVTTDLEKDGTPKKDKEGDIKRSFRAPKEDDWTLLKKKTEFEKLTELTNLAKLCIEKTGMGTDDVPDMLNICLDAATMPDPKKKLSWHELQAKTYMNVERQLADLLATIHHQVGAHNVAFVITGTGYCVEPTDHLDRYRIPTGTVYINRVANLLNLYLGALYGSDRYVDGCSHNQIYLNAKDIEQKRLRLNEILSLSQSFLLQCEGIRNAYTLESLQTSQGKGTEAILRGMNVTVGGHIALDIEEN